MSMYGWNRPRFDPMRSGLFHFHLGQTSPEDLERRAGEAAAKYQALLQRASLIRDDRSRAEILRWVGSSDELGTPSERYRRVKDELDQMAPWDEIRTGHLDGLEEANAEFQARVVEAEKAGTYGPRNPLALVDSNGKLTGAGVGLVVVAALGLFLVPLTLK